MSLIYGTLTSIIWAESQTVHCHSTLPECVVLIIVANALVVDVLDYDSEQSFNHTRVKQLNHDATSWSHVPHP